MAQDCYTLFKNTYKQAIADGLAVAVATEAAGRAMDNCLKQQALQAPAIQPIVVVPGSLDSNLGPTESNLDRSANLGKRGK